MAADRARVPGVYARVGSRRVRDYDRVSEAAVGRRFVPGPQASGSVVRGGGAHCPFHRAMGGRACCESLHGHGVCPLWEDS